MNRKKDSLILAFFTGVLAGSSTILSVNKQAIARTALPMKIEHAEGTYTLTVPDTNTTKSAYGGRLRIYDVHIAKMFEVTYFDCQNGQPTSDNKALDGDVILAAQAFIISNQGEDVVIATPNVRHLTRFVSAKVWDEI